MGFALFGSSSESKSYTTAISPVMPQSVTNGVGISAFQSPMSGGTLTGTAGGDILNASFGSTVSSTHNENYSPTMAVNYGSSGASAGGSTNSPTGTAINKWLWIGALAFVGLYLFTKLRG